MDLEALQAAVQRGEALSYLPFWGHTRKGRKLGRECLSQWYPSPFEVDGTRYRTAEHFMMAEKARLFGDEASRSRILAAPEPGAAKALGRKVAGFDEATWIEHRFDIVVRGNVAKFSADDGLRAFLVATGSAVLVEASPRDRIWGIGISATHPDLHDPFAWPGLNLLGFALMRARETIRAGS